MPSPPTQTTKSVQALRAGGAASDVQAQPSSLAERGPWPSRGACCSLPRPTARRPSESQASPSRAAFQVFRGTPTHTCQTPPRKESRLQRKNSSAAQRPPHGEPRTAQLANSSAAAGSTTTTIPNCTAMNLSQDTRQKQLDGLLHIGSAKSLAPTTRTRVCLPPFRPTWRDAPLPRSPPGSGLSLPTRRTWPPPKTGSGCRRRKRAARLRSCKRALTTGRSCVYCGCTRKSKQRSLTYGPHRLPAKHETHSLKPPLQEATRGTRRACYLRS